MPFFIFTRMHWGLYVQEYGFGIEHLMSISTAVVWLVHD